MPTLKTNNTEQVLRDIASNIVEAELDLEAADRRMVHLWEDRNEKKRTSLKRELENAIMNINAALANLSIYGEG